MTRLDAAISLVIFSIAVGIAWCALNYQAPFAGYLGLGLFVLAAAWFEASEDAMSNINDLPSALKSNKKEAEIMSVKHKVISVLKSEIVRMEKQLAISLARVKQAELVSSKILDYQKLISSLEKEITQEKIFFEEIFQVLDGLRVGSIYDTEQSDIARIKAMIRDKLANSCCEAISVEKMAQLIELVRLTEWVISNSSRQTVVNMIGYQKRIRAKFDELGIKRISG